MIFFDTETCGFHGLAILLQYAEGEAGEIKLYNFWTNPVGETLKIIEWITQNEVCGFNLAFDWFHLCKIYTVFSQLDYDVIPIDDIELIALLEPLGRTGPCLKPKSACDLMLFARKGPYQSLMNRKDIRIRRVPSMLAEPLSEELNKRVKLDDIYFSRKKQNTGNQWGIYDCVTD